MKKIISLILCLMLCFGFCACAEDELTLNVKSGDTVSTDLDVLEGSFVNSYDKILLFLDGVKIGEAENTNEFSFEIPSGAVYIGTHIAQIVAIGDGTYENTVTFTAEENIEAVMREEDFNKYEGGDKVSSNVKLALQNPTHDTVAEKVAGVTGEEGDIAARMYGTGIIKLSKPYVNIAHDFIYKHMVMEFDIKLDNTNTQAYVEMQNGGGGNAAFYFTKGSQSYIFDHSGKFFAGERAYEANVWYHVKGEINFDTKEQYLTVYNYNTKETITLLDGEKNTDADCTKLRLARINLASPEKEGCGYTVDNINLRSIENYRGIKEIKYVNGNDSENAVTSALKPSDVKKINIYLHEALLETADLKESVSIIGEKGTAEYGEIAYNAETKCISIISPTLSEGEKYLVKINMSAFTSAILDDKKSAAAVFETGYEQFGIISGDILVNGNKFYSPEQLGNSNTVSAKIKVCTGEDKVDGIMVLTVRDGKKIVGMKAHEISIEKNLSEKALPDIFVEGIGKLQEPKVQCMIFDSFMTRNALVPSIEMK